MISAAFVSVALVLGEFTIASLLNFNTLPVVIDLLGKSDAAISVAGLAGRADPRVRPAPVPALLRRPPNRRAQAAEEALTVIREHPAAGVDGLASSSLQPHLRRACTPSTA